METSKEVDTTRVYQKGPEFLRKQMELESESKGGMSAVERLAASKPKYVKSQQVVNTMQLPVIHIGSASVSSNGSSNRSKGSRDPSGNRIPGRNPTDATGEEPVRPPELESVARRYSSKKRPDSLLLYRQKCDLLKRPSTNERNKRNIGNSLLYSTADRNGPLLEAADSTSEEKKTTEGITTGSVGAQSGKLLTQLAQQHSHVTDKGGTNSVLSKAIHNRVAEVKKRSSKGVNRSHSDISSRYSKNFADFNAFFQYCGLDGEMIQCLGKENFSAHSDEAATRSVSVSTSDGGFSRNSGDSDGLLAEELCENIRQGTSEREVRVTENIKKTTSYTTHTHTHTITTILSY
ncbi:Protein FAM110C [Merluccius polli]|uniref:Protein FAM110C n=1 Tax=Merluccius polli TaxID=89951 RepID=A0AA47MJ86_MERPO|nr:Protein FAM110C [Merluccius polli]